MNPSEPWTQRRLNQVAGIVCKRCGEPFPDHSPECLAQTRQDQLEATRRKDCRLGTELLEAIDNRDPIRIGRILRGELKGP